MKREIAYSVRRTQRRGLRNRNKGQLRPRGSPGCTTTTCKSLTHFPPLGALHHTVTQWPTPECTTDPPPPDKPIQRRVDVSLDNTNRGCICSFEAGHNAAASYLPQQARVRQQWRLIRESRWTARPKPKSNALRVTSDVFALAKMDRRDGSMREEKGAKERWLQMATQWVSGTDGDWF